MAVLAPQPHRIKTSYREFDTTIVKFESGAEQRFCNREEEVVGFKLTWYFLNLTEQAQLRDFFRARKGAYEAFYIRNHHEPTGYTEAYDMGIITRNPIYKTYKVRFKEDKLTFNHFNQNFAACECEVVLCL